MSFPSSEQLVRLFDFFKEEKLTDAGLQEVFDRAKELELSGLYKRMTQSARALFESERHFEQRAQLAGITRFETDYDSAYKAAAPVDADDVSLIGGKFKALLILAEHFPKKRKELLAAATTSAEAFESAWYQFKAWRQLYDVSREHIDYERMMRASDRMSDKLEKLSAWGILEKINPDVEYYGSWIVPALNLLDQMPMDMIRFQATAKLALTVHDKRCHGEFAKSCGEFQKLLLHSALVDLSIMAVFANYSEFGFDWRCDFQIALGMAELEHAGMVNTIVDGLLAVDRTDEVYKIAGFVPESGEIKNAVLARLMRFYLARGLFPEAFQVYGRIKPENQSLWLEYCCAEAERKQTRKSYEAMRQAAEKLPTGHFEGLLRIAEITGDSRDAAKLYELVKSHPSNSYANLNWILSLSRITKQRLDQLLMK